MPLKKSQFTFGEWKVSLRKKLEALPPDLFYTNEDVVGIAKVGTTTLKSFVKAHPENTALVLHNSCLIRVYSSSRNIATIKKGQ